MDMVDTPAAGDVVRPPLLLLLCLPPHRVRNRAGAEILVPHHLRNRAGAEMLLELMCCVARGSMLPSLI